MATALLFLRGCLLASAILHVGCATTTMHLKPKPIDASSVFAGFECNAPIIVIDKRRSHTEHFKYFSTSQAADWLRGSLQSITDNELSFVNENDKSNNALTIELRHAYIINRVQSKVGIVSIRAKQNNHETSFRSQSTKINWLGSRLEYTRLLNAVMKDVLLKFARSPDFCRHAANT